jgi:hypothetical protein
VGSEVLGETQCPLPGSPEIPRAGEDGGGPVTQFDHLIGQRRRTCAVTDLDGSKRQIGLRDHGHPSARLCVRDELGQQVRARPLAHPPATNDDNAAWPLPSQRPHQLGLALGLPVSNSQLDDQSTRFGGEDALAIFRIHLAGGLVQGPRCRGQRDSGSMSHILQSGSTGLAVGLHCIRPLCITG